jgi:hypothetical protein
VLKAVGEDVGEAATELMKTITPAKIESWTRSKSMDWANDRRGAGADEILHSTGCVLRSSIEQGADPRPVPLDRISCVVRFLVVCDPARYRNH